MDDNSELPTMASQRRKLRKERYSDPARTSIAVRPLLAAEDLVRYLLLWTGVDSRLVTFSWFLVALSAHSVTAIGAPWSFAAGAGLVYFKIILDIADGEIGRYQKQHMTEYEDVVSHMKGLYLDRVQHLIEGTLWGLALGVGVYRLTGNVAMLGCGVSVAIFRAFYRFDRLVEQQIVERFQVRLNGLQLDAGSERMSGMVARRDPSVVRLLFSKIFSKIDFYLRNGKRFNLALLVFGGAEWVLSGTVAKGVSMQLFLGVAGALCLCSVAVRIGSVQFDNPLLQVAANKREEGPNP